MKLSDKGIANLMIYYADECAACDKEDIPCISDSKIEGWLESHDKNWADLSAIPDLENRLEKAIARLDEVIDERNAMKNAIQKIYGHDCTMSGPFKTKCPFCRQVAKSILEPGS